MHPIQPHDGTPAGVVRFYAARAEDDARREYAAARNFARTWPELSQMHTRVAARAARRAAELRAELAAMTGTEGA